MFLFTSGIAGRLLVCDNCKKRRPTFGSELLRLIMLGRELLLIMVLIGSSVVPETVAAEA